jgi:hypothetical protein
VFGLLGERALAGPYLLEGVGRGRALLAAARGPSGAQLEAAQLLGGQRRARERVVLAVVDQVPAQYGQLARGRHDRDLHPAAGAHPLIERAQRARRL